MRFDGTLGFPGGFVEDEENLESGLAREVSEELGATAGSLNYMESDLVVSHECFDKKLCLHFYCKKIELEVLRIIEKELIDCPQYGLEVSFLFPIKTYCPIITSMYGLVTYTFLLILMEILQISLNVMLVVI